MGHRIDNDVDPDPICGKPILEWISGIVYPLPCITQVAVARYKSKEPALFVLNSHVVRNDAPFFMGYTTTQPPSPVRIPPTD